MKISPETIIMESLAELRLFNEELQLSGILKFEEPIVDNSEKVLIKENIVIKDKALERLAEMEGSYQPVFKVKIDKELLEKIRLFITNATVDLLKLPESDFIAHLYKDISANYKKFIFHAYANTNLVLAVYKAFKENRSFFNHVSSLGLLSMAIMIQHPVHIRLIHRYAFLTGLICDLIFIKSNAWKSPSQNFETQTENAIQAAKLASNLGLPVEVERSVQGYPVQTGAPDSDSSVRFQAAALFDDEPDEASSESTDEDADKEAPVDEMAISMLIEIIKLAHFIHTTALGIDTKSHFAEELVYIVSYNSSKGYFHTELVNSIIKKFKDYEQTARCLMQIGFIEGKCLKGDQALAYSKPRPTQILCVGSHYDCPNVVTGWNINIINSSTAFGLLGTNLEKGSYPKCILERELKDLC
ncbi:MAG: hypothetical protein KDK39_00920 [Leptospiraceae bacterium]|nr:hypothetical protein [Leptospiraceae bacterium]